MSEPDLQRVEDLFHAAADLPEADRSAYLDTRCDGDAALRSRVEALLDRLARDESLASPVPRAGGGPFPAAAILEGPGTVIGRYKLLQVIGEGGFGIVYMAEQQQPVVRKVALKIIKLGMDTREVVARFEAERQALALMDHPCIARVLDGGATTSGRPYFVMELVRGVPITDFCDRNRLTTAERLELFVQICRAVQHAHQKGIIHRDLKPSNVLVTLDDDGTPRPMVIDFGVAKAMNTRLTEKTLFTRYEQFMGTPAYMSPEQAQMSALDIDTRTDIYSLGVLLYELLSGTTPFDTQTLMKSGLAEVQRVIREEQPPRPSVRISTTGAASTVRHGELDRAALSRRVRGDLDWIVMRALEKDRRRRYATASELAEDVKRHLDRQPVLAGPPSASYRLTKFLARNRTAAISITLVALALVAGIIGTTLGKVEADRSAALAQQRADHADAALDFLEDTLSLTDPEVALDPEVTVLTLLDHTSAGVATAFGDQPWAEIRIRATIGRAYASLSRDELAEPHLRRAVELVDEITAGRGFADAPGFDAGDFYTILWQLTNVCFNLERPDAFAMAERAHDVGLEHIGTTHPHLADALERFNRALAADAWSHDPNAMKGVPEMFEDAAAIADATVEHGSPLWPIIAERFLAAGYTIWYTPHEPLSQSFFAKALEIQQRELPSDHPDIGTTVGLLVGVLNKAGKTAEAEQLIRSSIESLRRVHRHGDYRIAIAESSLGENLVRQGRFEEAEPILLNAHQVVLATVKNPTNFWAIESFVRLVTLYDAWGRPQEAAPYRNALADTCAEADYIVQWEIARHSFGPEHTSLIELLDEIDTTIGGVHYLARTGSLDAPDLVARLNALVRTRRQLLDDHGPRAAAVARLLLGWANGLDRTRDVEARRIMAAEALAVLRHRPGRVPLEVAEALAILAETSRAAGAEDEARARALEAWQLTRDAPGSGTWFNAASEIRIARCLVEERLYAEAEALLVPAHENLVAQLGSQHVATRNARRMLTDLYTNWGRPEDARRYLEGGTF